MFDAASLLRLRRLESLALGPQGDLAVVVASRLADDESRFVQDLWQIRFDGSQPIRLTTGESSDHSPVVLDGGDVLFLSDRETREGAPKTTQVWRLPIRGEARPLTDEPAGVSKFVAAADTLVALAPVYGVDDPHAHHAALKKAGPSALHYRQMPVRHWKHWLGPSLHLIMFRDGERLDLTPDAAHEHLDSSFAITRDGRALAAVRGRDLARMRSDEVVMFLLGDEPREYRTLGTERCRYTDLVFDRLGTRCAATRYTRRDDAPEFRSVCELDFARAHETPLAAGWDRFGTPYAWLDDDTLLVAADDESTRPLFEISIDNPLADPVPHGKGSFPPSVHAASHAAGRTLAIGSGLVSAPSLVSALWTPDEEDGTTKTSSTPIVTELDLARLNVKDAPPNPSFRVEALWVETSDDEKVQGLIAFPDGPGPHPTLLWIHGGPISQFGDQWHWRWNVAPFVAAGYAVALPNARGSTGRGDAYMAAIYRDWAGRCHEDLMEFASALAQREDVDETRLGAMGGSFGGYMCNWIGANPDERFQPKALVTHASLYDLRAFYGATDYPAFFGDFFGATPWSGDSDRQSPHTGIARWKTPTLILHGEKDYRVPIGEGLALFEALQAHEVPSELIVYPDEGHWIERPRNVAHWYENILTFLASHLESTS